jgi:serine/threonine protein kinase
LHGDVKPDNILLAGNKLYIADFGFATFKPIECAEKVEMLGGTASYGMTLDDPHITGPAPDWTSSGAPEAFKKAGAAPPIDIWSFGCVLSLHATWIIAGTEGIERFAMLRQMALAEKMPGSLSDAFHDGQKVLKEVSDWHNYLISLRRVSDATTLEVLKLVDNSLLVADPSRQLPAKDLDMKLGAILEGVDYQPSYQPRPTLIEVIHRIEDARKAVEEAHRSLDNVDGSGTTSVPVTTAEGYPELLFPPPSLYSSRLSMRQSRRNTSQTRRPSNVPSINSPRYPTRYSVAQMSPDRDNGIPTREKQPMVEHDNRARTSKDSMVSSQGTPPSGLPKSPGSSTHSNRPPTTHRPSRDSDDQDVSENENSLPNVNDALWELVVCRSVNVWEAIKHRDHAMVHKYVRDSDGINSLTDEDGQTILIAVARSHDLEMLALLLDYCNVKATDNEGKTALHYAVVGVRESPATMPQFLRIIDRLKEKDPKIINKPDHGGHTPLNYAYPNMLLIKELVNKGSRINLLLLKEAAYYRDRGCVKFCLDLGDVKTEWIDEALRVCRGDVKNLLKQYKKRWEGHYWKPFMADDSQRHIVNLS